MESGSKVGGGVRLEIKWEVKMELLSLSLSLIQRSDRPLVNLTFLR